MMRTLKTGWLFALALLLAACGERSEETPEAASAPSAGGGGGDGPVRVAVSIPPLAWAARAVFGDGAEIDVILPGGASLHGWEPTPSDVEALASADVAVMVGEGLDAWMLDGGAETVVAMGEPTGDHSGHAHGPVEPHLWMTTSAMGQLIERLRGSAVEEGLATRAEVVDRSSGAVLEIIELERDQMRLSTVVEGLVVVTGHDAWRRFFAPLGAAEVIPLRTTDTDEPTPSEIDRAARALDGAAQALVVLEAGRDEPWLEGLASERGAPTATLEVIGGEDWLATYRSNLEAVASALTGGGLPDVEREDAGAGGDGAG